MHPAHPGQVLCGVCETAQPPATACAVCGMSLKLPPGVRPVADPPIRPLEGLERTHHEDRPVPVASLPGLESTASEPVPEWPAPPLPGFEPTAALEVLVLPGDEADRVPGFEPTSDSFERTPGLVGDLPPGCPWCGYAHSTGRVCDHCGRSRSRVIPRTRRAARPRPEGDEEAGRVRCRGCGASVAQAPLCSDCGMPLPSLDAF